MRILFGADVLPDPNSGAAGTEWQTIRALRALGHEVDEVWAPDLGRRIRHGNLHYLLELPRNYRGVVRDRCLAVDYDVIHLNQGHCFLAARDHQRRRRRGVFVCRSHGLDDRMDQILSEWRKVLGIRARRGLKALAGRGLDAALHRHDRLAYRFADGVIVSSSGDRDYLLNDIGLPSAKVACIAQAPPAPFAAATALPMTESRVRKLLHVGGFAYWKGVHAVAAAANDLFYRNSDVSLTWVCREEEIPAVRAMLSEVALARTRMVSWLPQDELRQVYDEHGIFLAPSLFDGFGKVFLEAMSRGMCVVGTATGGMPDVIRDGVDGYVVGFNDAPALVERVQALLSTPTVAASVSVAAAARAREYSWHRVATETAAFYEQLIEEKRGHPID